MTTINIPLDVLIAAGVKGRLRKPVRVILHLLLLTNKLAAVCHVTILARTYTVLTHLYSTVYSIDL